MPIQFTDECELELITGQSTHEVPVDKNLRRLAAILRRVTTINLTANITLTTSQLAYRFLKFTGTGGLIASLNGKPGEWTIRNGTGGQLTVRATMGEPGKTIESGDTVQLVSDGVNLFGMASGGVAWANVSGKPATFAPSAHDHDDRYLTDPEIAMVLDDYLLKTARATANGVAPLDASSKLVNAYLNGASAATANAVAIRDAAGRMQTAAPNVAADVANKGYVDSVEAVTLATLGNGWVNYGAPYANTGFYKDRGRVYLIGAVKDGTLNTTLFPLPVGYRPASRMEFVVRANTGTGYVYVDSSGNVVVQSGSNVHTSLNDIHFPAA